MDLPAALRASRLVAIVRGDDPDAALRTVLALVDEGIALVEVSSAGGTRSASSRGPVPRSGLGRRSARGPC